MLKTFIEENSTDVNFYRRGFRSMIYFAFFLLFINVCLVAVLYLNLLSLKQAPYFATTSDGRLIQIEPD